MLPDFSNKEKFLNKLEEVEDFLKEIKNKRCKMIFRKANPNDLKT